MQEVLENLKSNQILYSQNVLEIRSCIAKRYPDYSTKQTALLFATAIHKIIGKHMLLFDKSIQNDLKISLLQQALQKDVFDISAYDIFAACTALDLSHESSIENLTNWVNTYQDIQLSKDELFQFVLQLKENEITVDSELPCEELTATMDVSADPLTRFNTLKCHALLLLNLIKSHNRSALAASIMALSVFIFFVTTYYENDKSKALVDQSPTAIVAIESQPFVPHLPPEAEPAPDHPLPHHLQYKEIDTVALMNWLKGRDSMLADEPYFSSIIEVAKEYDINPLLMFAITGQEQGFVPRSNKRATSIANNPFNVFGSWQDFNTDITDTSKIAARTVLNLSKDRPENIDAVQWINRKYAEDPNWHKGVSQIFVALEKVAGK